MSLFVNVLKRDLDQCLGGFPKSDVNTPPSIFFNSTMSSFYVANGVALFLIHQLGKRGKRKKGWGGVGWLRFELIKSEYWPLG